MVQTNRTNERRVYREIAFPVSAFDVLQDLKRLWRIETNGEVLSRLLLSEGRRIAGPRSTQVTKNADTSRTRDAQR